MSKKPAAALSASLVAVKGMATPAPDMPGRAAPAAPVAQTSTPEATEPQPTSRIAEHEGGREGGLSPLNFRVPASFRREFKTYAAQHDMKLNELLRRSFEAFRKAQGD